jgi:hypothetical protein
MRKRSDTADSSWATGSSPSAYAKSPAAGRETEAARAMDKNRERGGLTLDIYPRNLGISRGIMCKNRGP